MDATAVGASLDAAEGDRLYAILHLMRTRGLRRGEAVDLDAGLITPAKEIVVDGWDPYEPEPRTDGSANTITLDSTTISELRDHKARQQKKRAQWGEAWQDTGKVFTKEDGSWLHPGTVTPFRPCSPGPMANTRSARVAQWWTSLDPSAKQTLLDLNLQEGHTLPEEFVPGLRDHAI